MKDETKSQDLKGGNKPKTDEEVQAILERDLPSEGEYLDTVEQVFLVLLSSHLDSKILLGEPTSRTREQIQLLHRHAEQIAEQMIVSVPTSRSNYELLRARQFRKVKFLS